MSPKMKYENDNYVGTAAPGCSVERSSTAVSGKIPDRVPHFSQVSERKWPLIKLSALLRVP